MDTLTPWKVVAADRTRYTARCECGHLELVHALNAAKKRTWCTHMDAAGPCPCRGYEEAAGA